MNIGIAPTDEAVAKFNEFKFSANKYYLIYKIHEDKEIVIEHEGETDKKFEV